MKSPEGKVSLIVPTFNGEGRLRRLFASIAQARPAELVEVIVCDDGSSDDLKLGTEIFEGGPALVHLRQERSGARRGTARNLGIEAAKGSILLFMDDDCIIGRKTISAHVLAHLSQASCAAVGFRTRWRGSDDGPRITLDYRRRELGSCGQDLERCHAPWRFAFSCNLSVSGLARNFRFSNRFQGWGYEDLEYSYRLYEAGIPFRCASSGSVWHIDEVVEDPFRRSDLGEMADFSSAVINAVRMAALHPSDQNLKAFILDEFAGLTVRNGRCLRVGGCGEPEFVFNWAAEQLTKERPYEQSR